MEHPDRCLCLHEEMLSFGEYRSTAGFSELTAEHFNLSETDVFPYKVVFPVLLTSLFIRYVLSYGLISVLDSDGFK